MKKILLSLILLVSLMLVSPELEAGNPDRQGEAGAPELLMNPWAPSAGLHTMNTSFISGVEAMRLNAAGLSRIQKTQVLIGHTQYLDGTDISLNAFGLAQKVGENGVIGVSIMAVDFGDIPVTTTELPEGTGATFSPNFFNLGIGYSHMFENKISVGFLIRLVSESTADLSAQGFAIDAGVQYVTGPEDNFKFGISLRNIGTRMKFQGEGLAIQQEDPNEGEPIFTLTYNTRPADFELPGVLNIGLSYDFLFAQKHRITALGNFTSNSFSRDQVGAGLEYAFNEMFMLRGAYKYEIGSDGQNAFDAPVYTGLSAGVSVQVPLKKNSSSNFGVHYAYRHTKVWSGTHNISVMFDL